MTHFAGVVTVPRQADFPLRHIDFVALPDARVLVILVFSDNQVQNRIVQLARPLGSGELEQAANYLNSHFAGLRVDDIRAHLLSRGAQGRQRVEPAAGQHGGTGDRFVRAADDGPGGADVLVSGQTNLMGYSELADMQRLRELFEAFQQKNELLQLMEVCAQGAWRAAVHRRGIRLYRTRWLQRGHRQLRRAGPRAGRGRA